MPTYKIDEILRDLNDVKDYKFFIDLEHGYN